MGRPAVIAERSLTSGSIWLGWGTSTKSMFDVASASAASARERAEPQAPSMVAAWPARSASNLLVVDALRTE